LPKAAEILEDLTRKPSWRFVSEVVFCGIGEPLLRYDCVSEVCKGIRASRGAAVRIRVDTSGLFWNEIQRLDVLDYIDVLSVSLNAESSEKYEELCRPKIKSAYDVLMSFLGKVKERERQKKEEGFCCPEVHLSVVDTSEEEFIPVSGRNGYVRGSFPVPDIDACRRIAERLGWSLVVKRLFRDSQEARWNNRPFEDLCMRGISPESCANCSYRH
jgi:TatD family-associated radical SAM protein